MRIVVDSDAGIDDAAAVFWLASRPEVELLGCSVVAGNVGVDRGVRNLAAVLRAARPDGPLPTIAAGATAPAGPVPPLRPATFIHGEDGLGDCGIAVPDHVTAADATAWLSDVAGSGGVTVVTMGPLTNLAHVIAADPTWPSRVERLVVMGGAIAVCGNARPQAEANIAHDPVAAATVARAAWARPPLLVGLDVTHRATFTPELTHRLEARRSTAAAFLAGPLAFYRRFAGTFCAPGQWPCHDLLAAMAAVLPGLVSGPVLPLAVQDTPGPAWGATVADRRVPFFERAGQGSAQAAPEGFAPWEVGLEVDVERFREEVGEFLG